MSNNSEEQHRDNSNDHLQKPENKKMHDYVEDYYQGNPSPRFTPMQYPSMYTPMPPPMFDLENKGTAIDHMYPGNEYFDPSKQPQNNSDRKGQSSYPFRKHSIGEVPQMDHYDDDPHRAPMPYPFGYYQPMKYTQPMYLKYPPPPQGQYMVPPPPWYPQRQQLMPPFWNYPPYNDQIQNTVSKELQSKVYQLVSYQKVSDFQCNCKKSKCLKLYCECFANNWVCSQSCNCQDCKNRIDNPQERSKAIEEALLRNPDAFASCFAAKGSTFQVQAQESKSHKEPVKETGNLARKGCNCKKSGCKKKYCECYSSNLKCSDLCKCEHCLNRTDAEIQAQQDIVQALDQDPEENVPQKIKSKKIKKEHDEKSDSQKPVVQVKINLSNSGNKKKKLDKS